MSKTIENENSSQNNATAACFGKRLSTLRKEVKLSRANFAARIGINGDSLIAIWECGGGYPSCETLKKIGEVFGTDIHELLLGEPSPGVHTEVKVLRDIKHSFRRLLLDIQGRIESFKKIDRLVNDVINIIETHTKERK